MKSKRELRQYYNKSIAPHVYDLEAEAKKHHSSANFWTIIILAMFVIAFFGNSMLSGIFGPIFFFTFVVVFVMAIRLSRASSVIEKKYIKLIFKPLLKEISPSLKFYPKKGISSSLLKKSRIYPKGYDTFKSNNLCKGIVDGRLIRFANVELSEEGRKDGSVAVFEGLYIDTSMKKKFDGTLCIYPDYEELFLGFFGKSLQSGKLSDLQKITLDSPLFEKYFKIYTDNPVQAPYILTHSMMERILLIREKTRKLAAFGRLSITFSQNKVFLGINGYTGILQPSQNNENSSYFSFDNIEHQVDLLEFIIGLSDELNLESVA